MIAARIGQRGALGPGDDLAIMPRPTPLMAAAGPGTILIGADAMIEGVHFLRGTDWSLVGRKALTRNLSDVAAMGATPLACVACAQFRPDMSLDDVGSLLDGLVSTASSFGCPLLGGDTSIHSSLNHPFTIAVTITAALAPGQSPFTRCTAQPGDDVFVSGTLGGSFGDGHGSHLTFTPRVALASALRTLHERGTLRITSMMDLSDGLGRDAARLAHASNVHLALDRDAIPASPRSSLHSALADGEDYELLFTTATGSAVPLALREVPITHIGRVHAVDTSHPEGAFLLVGTRDGERVNLEHEGWDHGGCETLTLIDATATEALGERLAKQLHQGDCVLLHGDLGAGKTTLVRGLARGLGADPDHVSSPTFVTLQVYDGTHTQLVHVDAYRATGAASIESTGLGDWLAARSAIVVIEWPDRLGTLVPHCAIHVTLEHAPGGRVATVRNTRSSMDSPGL